MIRKKRGLGSLTALAVSSATILGGLFATSGTAYAGTTVLSTSNPWLNSSKPNIYPGATNQVAGDWTFTVSNTFTAGETYTVDLGPNNTLSGGTASQCQSGTNYVGFAGVPKVSSPTPDAANTGTTDQVPNISAAIQENPTDGAGCTAAGVKDQLVLTISNTAASGATAPTSDKFDVTVSGVKYNVGAGTPAAPGGTDVALTGSDESGLTGATATSFGVDANASLQPLAITANAPPVGIVPGTSHAISNIVLKESLPDTVKGNSGNSGAVVLSLPGGDTFTSTVTVTVSSGDATICAKSTCTAGATTAAIAPATTPPQGIDTVTFFIKTPSTVPSTFTFSGMTIAVATGESPGPQTASINYDGTNSIASTAFAVISFTRTAGFTADDTAAASFQSAFPDTDGDGMGKYRTPNTTCGPFSEFGGGGNNSGHTYIVLVADFTPFDALSANYLASWAGTGVVITPYNSLSSAAANIIRNYGVGTVYIVGGTAAVSQAVQTQLQSMQAYCPGGSIPDFAGSSPVTLKVVRIAGTTAAETSSDVAQFPGAANVGGECATPGAYPNTWNTTTGMSSASGPATTGCFNTAIVATDFTFQDALGAGPLSYNDSLPVVLTDQGGLSNSAAAALVNLGIQQVYLLGGPGAVSDAVVTSIQNLGISVLRIAGLTFGETSTQLARFELNDQNSATPSVTDGLDIGTPAAIGSARGDDYTDALTSAAALTTGSAFFCDCSSTFHPLVLTTNASTVGSAVDSFLNDAGNTTPTTGGIGSNNVNIFALQVFGGTLAQTPALVQQELNDIATG